MMTGKNVEYFPHDCNASDDPKIMLMMTQLGLESYGIYWILIEYLRQQTGYRAPINLLDPLSRRYGSSKEKFETVITKFSLFDYNEEYFWSDSLIRRMDPLELKRERMREIANKRWEKDACAMRTHSIGNAQAMQSRVEKSKVEKSKVEKSRVEKSSTQRNFDYVEGIFLPAWGKWCNYKEEIKDPYKTRVGASTQYQNLIKLSKGDPELAMKIVNQSIASEWRGLFALKATFQQPADNSLDSIRNQIKTAVYGDQK